jgi:hypothetical protein
MLSVCLATSGMPFPPRTVGAALPRLAEAQSLTLVYDWAGLSSGAPYHVETQLAIHELPSHAPISITVGGYWKPKQTQLLTTTLTSVQWRAAQQTLSTIPLQTIPYQPIRSHTDDYPTLIMEIAGPSFHARFHSTSQGDRYLPWEAIINGQHYTITAPAIFTVWDTLQPTMRPDALSAAVHAIEADP